MLGKIIFHIIYSILIMVYLFIGIPYTTNSSFGNKISVVLFTILQMLYIILSSLQISHGYFLSPFFFFTYQLSHFRQLHQQHHQQKLLLLQPPALLRFPFPFFEPQCYRYIPFLFEIHQILDWAISNTSLNLMLWLKVYSAHAILYDSKCRVLHSFPFSSLRRSPMIAIRTNASSESECPSRKSVSARC